MAKDIMHTSNPICEYAFSWTIDNFSKTSLEVRGPTFSPIPGYSEKFCFELKFERSNMFTRLSVNLILLNAREISIFVRGRMTLRNTKKILTEKKIYRMRSPQNITLTRYSQSDISTNNTALHYVSLSDFGLADSKLIMEGTLKFSGYGVTSSISSLSAHQPSENCDEVLKDFKSMYESGLGSDVTFSVGDVKLRAHKSILLGRSPMFAKMFEHDMLENKTNNVIIEDFDSHTFNCFLVFLYTGVVQDDKYDTVISLYSVAQKYQVKSLQKTCSELLVKQLSVETVCRVLVLADLHNVEELKSNAKIFIRQNFFDIAGSTMWFEFVTNNPQLAQDVLSYMKSLHN